jgi:hypothetical protein
MLRTVSSPYTFLFKFIFPPLWIGGFGFGTLQLWLSPETVVFNGVRGGATREHQWLFLGALVLGAALLLWHCTRLHRVRLTDGGLLVSNYFREISVPFGQIARVTQSRLSNPRTITLHLRGETPLGGKVRFFPSTHGRLAFWKEDELVHELRARAGLVREVGGAIGAV